jgi:2-polyprenyl-3-methyl-5-hydroxy-6-metoxy-1,4-benzoquinol methylase
MDAAPYEHQIKISQEAIDRINQACYDNRADYWDRFPFPNALPEFVKKYYNPKLGKKVLDIGSGTGVLAKWLSDQGFEVLCLDPSIEMVKRCREKGLSTLETSFQAYVPQGQFAIAFAILSLIHVPKIDFKEQIKKIAVIVPKGGLLILGMLEGKSEGFFEGPDYPRFFAYYSPEEIVQNVSSYFIKKDYYHVKSGSSGYMLFVFERL